MNRHTLFISDIHLQEEQTATTAAFKAFITQLAPMADALYILGDFFDHWIGDDDQNAFNRDIIAQLHQLSKHGVAIYFMHGNRDFLIKKDFAQQAGLTLLPDPTVISLYGKPILLTHGDYLCTLDVKHQRFRHYTGKPMLQRLFLTLPLSTRRHIGAQLRHKSQTRQQTVAEHITDVTPSEVGRVMQQHHVELMIHGHTHRPAIHPVANLPQATRIVLGAWYKATNYLRYDEDGSYELVNREFSSSPAEQDNSCN